MCGIIGILGKDEVAPRLVEGLKRLEYRGYDSAGIATLNDTHLVRRRAEGKLAALERLLRTEPLGGTSGIGHTRWATHGAPVERNAHPHMTARVSVVHNGIIENFADLRSELEAGGVVFETETDTEVVLHLIDRELAAGRAPLDAVQDTLARLRGAFAFAILFAGENNLMIGARRGSPLAIGYGEGEVFLGSDAIALAPFTSRVSFLDEGDIAVLSREAVQVYDESGAPVTRAVASASVSAMLLDKGNYRHFMLKEIHEQPDAISRTLSHYIRFARNAIELPGPPLPFDTIDRVTISACGTAFYAGLVGKYFFERAARLPADVDIASEFRYREAPLPRNGLALFVSQSGETADTLASLRYCKAQGQTTAAIVNVQESTIARECHAILPTLAGPEIGVASTKAFTAQVAVLACLAIAAGRARGVLGPDDEAELVQALVEVPRLILDVLKEEERFEQLASKIARAPLVLYLGRGSTFPLALEGALKLKEVSYLHAEGFAAGELKHGPIALIDENVPVIAMAPRDHLFEKMVSNMQEVAARGGQLVIFSDTEEAARGMEPAAFIKMPSVHPFIAPLVYALPVQLLAYHTAVAIGTDVDQPRNLAKSVTVE